MNNQTEQFCRELNLSSGAKKHLEERSFPSHLIDKFKLGFCPAVSNYEFDLLNGRLIVPIYDVYGEEVAYAGRRIDDYGTSVKNFYQLKTNKFNGLEKFLKWKQSKWINTLYKGTKKSNHLYNLHNAKKAMFEKAYCIVVEGYFDVMYLYSLGVYNVVAICGTALSDRHCELIFRYCNSIALMLDGDAAGNISSVKSVHKAREHGLFAHVIELSPGTDPDDLLKEQINILLNEIQNSDEELYIKL